MKTTFTFKNRLTPHLFFLSVMIILIASPVFGSTKHVVMVTEYKFTPAELTISVGDTVEWKNMGGYHNVNGTQATYSMNPESFGNSPGSGWTYSHVFTASGKYDYQCDPHVGLGMVGMIEVGGKDDAKKTLTVDFSGMNPHVGQTLWLAVIDKVSGKEIERKSEIVSVDFSMQISGLAMNHSYNVDFFADHNKNGTYDTPPTDHAWRMALNDVMGDTTLNFSHNTSFTDINWIATAVSEISNLSFKMYPNPTTDRVFIEMDDITGSEIQVSIFDIAGKLKYQEIKPMNNKIEIDVQNLNNGIYLFVLKANNNKQQVVKFIKY